MDTYVDFVTRISKFIITITLSFTLLAGCGGGGGDTSGGGTQTTTYEVNATVVGMTSGSLVLQNNAGDDLTISTDGTYPFSTSLNDGSNYNVTVSSHPVGHTCTITNGTGTISGADATVSVNCGAVTSTRTLSVLVSGLSSGTLVLQNNSADDLSITANSTHSFSKALNDGNTYNVEVLNHPDGQNCIVAYGTGTVNGTDVTLDVTCTGANYSLFGFDLQYQAPSPIVVVPLSVTDKTSGRGIGNLTPGDFIAKENGFDVTSESFLDTKKADTIPFTQYTVLALDISSSVFPYLDTIKTSTKAMIQDASGNSLLRPGQQVSILTFDGTVKEVIGFTSDTNALITAINGITVGGNTTNLNGAIFDAVNKWTDTLSLAKIDVGAAIVITDGDDTSSALPESQAITARGNKKVFAVYTPNATNLTSLQNMANGGVFPISSDFNDLQNVLSEVNTRIEEFSNSLYVVYYASPKLTGNHTLELSVKGNQNTESDSVVTGTFDATGFVPVETEVVIEGPTTLAINQPIELSALTKYWKYGTDYVWSSASENYVSVTADPLDNSRAL
ncbi:MAG: VWA domain-containing protein, partial [Gammaproteobacteria bacterium]|nr:VWA domain-containing protein [Gammaproteobacteria bacterium]